ncbi:MAG TPA: hypothetical protein P5024_11205, partial [Burkholderiaceae bacterium]|nr:hypothetical protein [Burkholderiaceae bacterium]HRZ02114.1 hypothetical protein [Burkholderiaceae bacterium]
GIRQGDWKLIWRAPLPEGIELYDLAKDPYEKNNVAAQHPEVVARLRQRANELAATQQKSLLMQTEFEALRQRLKLPPALPGEELVLTE